MTEEFGGDVLLVDTLDGGEIEIENGLVLPDEGFRTATFLSLFGGNSLDDGKVDNAHTWWGNKLTGVTESEKLVSRFQHVIRTLPLTGKGLSLAEDAAKQDLHWMIDEGIADDVVATVTSEGGLRVRLEVVISKSGQIIEQGRYGLQWGAMANGI